MATGPSAGEIIRGQLVDTLRGAHARHAADLAAAAGMGQGEALRLLRRRLRAVELGLSPLPVGLGERGGSAGIHRSSLGSACPLTMWGAPGTAHS